jgi:two-component system LytT family response regulator
MRRMQSRARFARRGNTGPADECPAAHLITATTSRVHARSLLQELARTRSLTFLRRSNPAKRIAEPKPNDSLEGFCPEPNDEERIAVNSKGMMLFLRLIDIEWIEAADKGVKLRVGKQSHRLRTDLVAMAAKLPPGRFLRINRSTLVNAEHIKGLQRMFFGQYEVVLRNGARLPLTRAYFENMRQIGIALPESLPPLPDNYLNLGSPTGN